MTLAEAAAIWKEQKPVAKAAAKQVADAEKVLKEHFRKTGRTSYAGISYSVSTYDGLDTDLAKELLGKRVDDAMVTRTRETLTAL